MAAIDPLVEANADPNGRNNYHKQSPLFVAARDCSPDTAQALLRHGANLEGVDGNFGWTALHCAARYGSAPVARVLLGGGAAVDPVATDLCAPPLLHLLPALQPNLPCSQVHSAAPRR